MKKVLFAILISMFCLLSYGQDKTVSEKIATTIEFTVNTDNIIHNNHYDYYINTIVPFISDNRDSIESILLIGSASPEGNYNKNVILSNKRIDKVYSYIKNIIPASKVITSNNYNLFLSKTSYDEKNYPKLRATYIEINCIKQLPAEEVIIDTVYIDRPVQVIDTVFVETTKEFPISVVEDKLTFSLYNNIVGDLLARRNLGLEVYFGKASFFVEGSFSNSPFFGHTYNTQIWTTGFRMYTNTDYDKFFGEIYINAGYFDTDLFNSAGSFGIFYGGGLGIGYKFTLKYNWKIYPIIRIGIDRGNTMNYYYSGGNIDISFDKYINGKTSENVDQNEVDNTSQHIYIENRIIDNDFFKNSLRGYYFGPTYIGLVIQKDFIFKTNKQ